MYFYRIMIFDAESKTEFANNSLNSPKFGKLNIDTLIIPQGLLINIKNQSSKISCYCPFKLYEWQFLLSLIQSEQVVFS